MKRILALASLAAFAIVTPAMAQYQWYENFEDGLAGWSLWTERGTNTSAAEAEPPTLGSEVPWSGGNQTLAHVGGNGFNGGIWQVVTLPLGPGTYTIDGYWRTHGTTPQSAWGEVIVKEGNSPPTNGVDTTGPLHYKNDTWASQSGWSGQISATAPVTNLPSFTTASGTITIILKHGNIGGTSAVDFDDISITPEPTTMALLGLPALFLRRRRRA